MHVYMYIFIYISASQMWLLGRILPLILGHVIPAEDERWMNLTLLLRILEQLLAHSITVDQCVNLMVNYIELGLQIVFNFIYTRC